MVLDRDKGVSHAGWLVIDPRLTGWVEPLFFGSAMVVMRQGDFHATRCVAEMTRVEPRMCEVIG